MIDEKKIEEAAIDASIEDTNKGIVRDGYVISAWADHELGFQEGFKAGINWFLDNLWHDASEEPKGGKQLVLRFPNGNCYACYRSGEYYKTPNISEDKYDIINPRDITRWFYLDDLPKGGK